MSTFVMPSSENDKKKIKGAINEIVDHLTMIAGFQDKIKEVNEYLKDEFDMPSSLSNKSARLVIKGSFSEEQAKFEELETLNHLVTGA